ncbi:MAG: hypothetical protein GY939_09000 [Actinomycetia bacterium]|nr:hypothetical protein [Actinomycetes bacterium]
MEAELAGLTQSEVTTRIQEGKTNAGAETPSRTVADILRANAFNSATTVLLSLGVVLTLMGRMRDGLINVGFIVAIVAIVAVGSFQEIRAKRRLDEIVILSTPTVTVR